MVSPAGQPHLLPWAGPEAGELIGGELHLVTVQLNDVLTSVHWTAVSRDEHLLAPAYEDLHAIDDEDASWTPATPQPV
ncbi:hypothetical protein SUDANB96_05450 [Streptomyces sp. enrichment culture]